MRVQTFCFRIPAGNNIIEDRCRELLGEVEPLEATHNGLIYVSFARKIIEFLPHLMDTFERQFEFAMEGIDDHVQVYTTLWEEQWRHQGKTH